MHFVPVVVPAPIAMASNEPPPSKFIEPDPDIAGIGVLSAFIITGSLVMILAMIKILIVELPGFRLSHLVCPQATEIPTRGNRPTFSDAKTYLRGEEAKDDSQSVNEERPSALSDTLFSLGDTQFAMGIAIAVAAIAKRDITLYHYLVCDEMAWLGLISSTAGLLTSRKLLEEPGSVKKAVRIILMWALFGLVFWIEVSRNDFIEFAEPVWERGRAWNISNAEGVLSLILLILSACSVVIDTVAMFPELGLLLYHYVDRYMSWLTRLPQSSPASDLTQSPWVRIALRGVFGKALFMLIWFPFWLLNVALYWFLFQPVITQLGNIFFFMWGVQSTFRWREEGRKYMKADEIKKEDDFGFGQVVALTMLISPIIANVDLWIGMLSPRSQSLFIMLIIWCRSVGKETDRTSSTETGFDCGCHFHGTSGLYSQQTGEVPGVR
ncbi:hypothetical protein ACO1O0_005020 [Amphichorda felina]